MFKFRLFSIALAVCLILALPAFLGPSASSLVSGAELGAAAGSADDPLVTLSYINKVFKPQLEDSVLKVVEEKLKSFTPPAASSPPAASNPPASSPPAQNIYIMSDGASSSYVVLELTKGQRLRVREGCLEFILRPGSGAVVISNFKTQGIADLTTGEELLNGAGLPINHSLLIPRNDGRGISVTSVVAYVMVRGDYEIY
ncbi:MAG: hypothetical protein FWD23_13660 [Oscillospiraceae bacterium]|nr:hypothetical protein [Oscillospiraceae bacterium]